MKIQVLSLWSKKTKFIAFLPSINVYFDKGHDTKISFLFLILGIGISFKKKNIKSYL